MITIKFLKTYQSLRILAVGKPLWHHCRPIQVHILPPSYCFDTPGFVLHTVNFLQQVSLRYADILQVNYPLLIMPHNTIR